MSTRLRNAVIKAQSVAAWSKPQGIRSGWKVISAPWGTTHSRFPHIYTFRPDTLTHLLPRSMSAHRSIQVNRFGLHYCWSLQTALSYARAFETESKPKHIYLIAVEAFGDVDVQHVEHNKEMGVNKPHEIAAAGALLPREWFTFQKSAEKNNNTGQYEWALVDDSR